MNFAWFFLIAFGFIFIVFPEFLSYILGFFFIFIGVSSLMASHITNKMKNRDDKWEYVKFGGYTIYTNKK
jgi:hypothetical protein